MANRLQGIVGVRLRHDERRKPELLQHLEKVHGTDRSSGFNAGKYVYRYADVVGGVEKRQFARQPGTLHRLAQRLEICHKRTWPGVSVIGEARHAGRSDEEDPLGAASLSANHAGCWTASGVGRLRARICAHRSAAFTMRLTRRGGSLSSLRRERTDRVRQLNCASSSRGVEFPQRLPEISATKADAGAVAWPGAKIYDIHGRNR